MVATDCVQAPLTAEFYRLGKILARHRLWFLVMPIVVTVLLAPGMVLWNTPGGNLEDLFTPIDSRSKADSNRIEHFFVNTNSSHFSSVRLLKWGQYGIIAVALTNGHHDHRNVLTPDIINTVIQLDKHIRDITVKGANGSEYHYKEVCSRNEGICFKDPLLELIQDYGVAPEKITFPVHHLSIPGKLDKDVFLGYSLGNVRKDNDVTHASVWKIHYFLQTDSEEVANAWQEQFIETIAKLEKSYKNVKILGITSKTRENELHRLINSVVPLYPRTIILVVLFSILACLSCDWVRAKPWLGLCGIIAPGMAVLSTISFCLTIGLPYIDMVAMGPLVVIGMGINSMFVMLAAWRGTDVFLPIEERTGLMFADAGMSMAMTTIADFLTILIGVVTQYRAVQIFCVYVAVSVLFQYIYMLTFFAACVVLCGETEARNQHSVTTCTEVVPLGNAVDRSCAFRMFCTGGIEDDEECDNGLFIMFFFREYWPEFLDDYKFKIGLSLVYIAYVTVALAGCKNVDKGLRLSRLTLDDSYANRYYTLDNCDFLEYGPSIEIMVERELRPWAKEDLDAIENLLQKFENTDYFYGPNLTIAWTRVFRRYIVSHPINKGNALTVLQQFLRDPQYSYLSFDLDVKFDVSRSTVVTSRYFVVSKWLNTTHLQAAMMTEARKIADANPQLAVTVYHSDFVIFGQATQIWTKMLQKVSIAVMVIFVVALVLIPQPLCCLWLVFSVFSITVGVFGFMSWWGVSIDSISSITTIMCIGFCVDFSMHVTSAFVLEGGLGRMERIRRSLFLVGSPILQGVVVTLVGVASITTPKSYFFRAMFCIVFLFIVFGAIHALVIIPAALLSFGPPSFDNRSIFRIQSRNAQLGLPRHGITLPVNQPASSSWSSTYSSGSEPAPVPPGRSRMTIMYITPVRAHLRMLDAKLKVEALTDYRTSTSSNCSF